MSFIHHTERKWREDEVENEGEFDEETKAVDDGSKKEDRGHAFLSIIGEKND